MTGRRLGVLVSGSGRSLQNLIDEIDRGTLDAEIGIVLSSRPGVMALTRAASRGIPTAVVDKLTAPTIDAASRMTFQHLEQAGVDLVVFAGFLRILTIPERYLLRVVNIHPALLPAFGGHGMFGRHVHEAVLRSGARVSGCTVHYVTNDVDSGPIIEQRVVDVLDTDTPDTLAARVFEAEQAALPRAIALHLDGKLKVEGRRVKRIDGGA
jgi:formyltetrahydrofolate-dependent phosphoribosylglycinamide formyltransferase